jgi:hypothetical protein
MILAEAAEVWSNLGGYDHVEMIARSITDPNGAGQPPST